MPHHIEDGDNVADSQPGHVTPDSQSGSLCTGSDTSRFLVGCVSDEACDQEHSKLGWTNDPAT